MIEVGNIFHHALKIDTDKCVGCSYCMRSCPTEALCLTNGKAELLPDRCVDCGNCYRTCPVGAIYVEQDDFEKIYSYKRRVALVPSVLIGQFPLHILPQQIYSHLLEIGFTDVFEVENSVLYQIEAMRSHCNEAVKPAISSFCPAIIRLIQVRFPSLIKNIVKIKQPFEISAWFYRNYLIEKGISPDEIGIFYITPCAAKIAAVKSPVGEIDVPIDGIINLDAIFNRLQSRFISKEKDLCPVPETTSWFLKGESVTWSLTGGEASLFDGRCLAIDGIEHVIEFLEQLENGKISNIDFLELRACDQSCAGGILTPTNRFTTVEKLNQRASGSEVSCTRNLFPQRILEHKEELDEYVAIDEIHPRNVEAVGDNVAEALQRLQRIRDKENLLPKVDCGLCGFPTCKSFAENMVLNKADENRCIFMFLQNLNEQGIIDDSLLSPLCSVWGKNKIMNKKYNGHDSQ